MEAASITFDEWLTRVFDHPVASETDDEWWWKQREEDEVGRCLDRPPERALNFVIRLFEEPIRYLSRYSDGQIDQGLNFIVFTACSNHFAWLMDANLDFKLRSRCIRSVEVLFRDLIAPRTSDNVWVYTQPLDHMCHMFWDLVIREARDVRHNSDGTFQSVRDPELDKVMLDTLSHILTLPGIACQQSALHGLGHLLQEAEIGREVIQKYLNDHPTLRSDVREYALRALAGRIL